MIKRGSKKGYEFGFSWIFAVLIGAVILFLAVYITTQLVDVKRAEEEAKRGKQLGVLLTPIETSLEEAKFATIILPDETKLFNDCDTDRGVFGSQDISTAIKSGIGDKWRPEQGIASSFHNKYLFSNATLHAEEEFYILSKPFKFPFKIADLMIAWSDKQEYCFTGLGSLPDLKDEIEDLKPKNIFLEPACPTTPHIKVCFSVPTSDCDIIIDKQPGRGAVRKDGTTIRYVESLDPNDKYALLYAAIFSNNTIYECQVKRLMARASELSALYKKKADYLTPKDGCAFETVMSPLAAYSTKTSSIASAGSSAILNNDIILTSIELKEKNNDITSCRLF